MHPNPSPKACGDGCTFGTKEAHDYNEVNDKYGVSNT